MMIVDVLLVCCVITVYGNVNDVTIDDRKDYKIPTPAEDVSFPQIDIVVRGYPQINVGHNMKELVEDKSEDLVENKLEDLVEENMLKDGEISEQGKGTNLLATNQIPGSMTKGIDDQVIEDDKENILITNEDFSSSLLTTSVNGISKMAGLAWSYVTQDKTERQDEVLNRMSNQDMENVVTVEDKQQENVSNEKLDKLEKDNEKNVVIEGVGPLPLHVDPNKTSKGDYINDKDIVNDDEDNYVKIERGTRTEVKKRKEGNKSVLSKSFSTSKLGQKDDRKLKIELKYGRENKNKENVSSKKKELDKIFVGNESLDDVDFNEINDYSNDEADGNNKRDWFAKWFTDVNKKVAEEKNGTEKNEIEETDAEDNYTEGDHGSASPAIVSEEILLNVDDPSGTTEYRPVISSVSSRPGAEADPRTSSVRGLLHHYEACDTCMETVKNTNQECDALKPEVDEFDRWSKQLSDLLKYGCRSQGAQHKDLCCHSHDHISTSTLLEISQVVKSVSQVFLKQCQKCPADCVWAEWEAWTSCPVTCDRPGYRSRSRQKIGERYGGRACWGSHIQTADCPAVEKEYGTWVDWSPWSSCSSTCGGSRHRTRKCRSPTKCACFIPCDNDRGGVEVESCGDSSRCCQPRKWAPWAAWTECGTVDSREKIRQRTRWRTCESEEGHANKPLCPQICTGPAWETDTCCTLSTWSEWASWSACVGTESLVDLETGRQCGYGCQNRTRDCRDGNCPNDICYGDHIERIYCKLDPCCEPPIWSEWGSWTSCSASVGPGVRKRERYCQPNLEKWSSPTCKAGGCYGQPGDKQSEDCQGSCRHCVPASWGSWEAWGDCDFSRNSPRRYSKRACRKNPWDAECGHLECEGEAVRAEACICAEPSWTSWSLWGACDLNQVPQQRRRYRQCVQANNPAYCPEEECTGVSSETLHCCQPQEWLSWEKWTPCDYSRDPPFRSRTRRCSEHAPGCPDVSCSGINQETRNCPTCDPGQWGTWASWGTCDCRDTKRRSRTREKVFTYTSNQRIDLCPYRAETTEEACTDQCDECQEICTGRKDGKYPSCKRGCRHYITCCQGKPIREECQGGQHYDSVCQKCRRPLSPTCPTGQYDHNIRSLILPTSSGRDCTGL